MPSEIYLVKVGMTMTEGSVEEWYVSDGTTVQQGDMLYRLETEKVNMDVDAETTGIVKHVVGEGTVCEPGDVIGYIYAADESIPDPLPGPEKRSPDEVVVVDAPEPAQRRTPAPRRAETRVPA
ncbi:MAG: biotin/lipoyl-binding protein, partial [Gammaproteobacteria bacterium]